MKKVIAFIIVLFLLATTFIPVESIPKTNKTIESVSFTRYGPDGSIKTFLARVEVEREQDISGAIKEKCREMLENDEEIQKFIDKYNKGAGLILVISAGNGLHFNFPPSMLKIPIWDVNLSFFPSLIYCNYVDENAETDIYPLIPKGNATTITGEHKVAAFGFIGIIGWSGMFSYSYDGWAGITPFLWTMGDSTDPTIWN